MLKENTNIKAWVCGHVHDKCYFSLGNCKIICNPRGYINLNEGHFFNKNLFLDTFNWNILE